MSFPMQVVELTAYHVRIPLVRPIRHASHSRDSTDNLIVRCVLDDRTEGFGEGVPREYVTGESIDSALDLLRKSDLASRLEPCDDFPAAAAMAERLRLAPVPGDDRDCRGNAARCAVELALLDAYGRRFGQPLARVTQLLAPDLYEPKDAVRYSGVITSARGGGKLLLLGLVLRAYRFRQIKVKVGIAGHDDVARLRKIRRLMRRNVDLRVDANEAWPAAEAAERIRALEPFGITSVEQPVPHGEVGALADVRGRVRTPIMLDESLCGLIDAERAIAGRTCDLFNLRLSKCGGFIPSLRLAQLARRHGLGYQLGCQVGETTLLSAAGRHFACSVAGLRYLEGSYDRHLVRESLGTRDITFGWGGKAPALAGHGLGVDLDPAALDRVAVRKEPILG
jgi:muconate cycloisomerase